MYSTPVKRKDDAYDRLVSVASTGLIPIKYRSAEGVVKYAQEVLGITRARLLCKDERMWKTHDDPRRLKDEFFAVEARPDGVKFGKYLLIFDEACGLIDYVKI